VEGSARGFFWRNKDIDKKGKCLVKWEKVCKPKKAGGIGVLSLRVQPKTMLMKNIFKFMNKQESPWVNLLWHAYYSNRKNLENSNPCGSFWWKDCLKLLNDFFSIAKCQLGDGSTIRLWHDPWHTETLKTIFPHLFSFAQN
jgi:hypothetical protein